MISQYQGSHKVHQSLVEPLATWCTELKRTYGICTGRAPTYREAWQEGAWALQSCVVALSMYPPPTHPPHRRGT
jgi:hypothetical protein